MRGATPASEALALLLTPLLLCACTGADIGTRAIACEPLPIDGSKQFLLRPLADGSSEVIVASNAPHADAPDSGALLAFRLSSAGAGPAEILTLATAGGAAWRPPGGFHPIAIAAAREGGRDLLFVVNDANPYSIERFRRDAETLVHERSYRSPLLSAPTHLVALSAEELYVSNAAAHGGWRRYLEWGLALDTGNVLHLHAAPQPVWRVAVRGLRFPSGIAYAAERDEMFVAEFARRRIRVYARDAATGELSERATASLRLPALPASLTWTPPYSLYIAAHGSLPRSACYFAGWCGRVPSRLLVVDVPGEGNPNPPRIVELAGADLAAIQAASMLAPLRDGVLLSQARRAPLQHCRSAATASGNG